MEMNKNAFIGFALINLMAIMACRGPLPELSAREIPAYSGSSLSLSLDLYASGFTSPVSLTNAGDERLYVVERAGVIRIIAANGNTLPVPFLDISSRVDSSRSEEGLLGLVFHPEYESNGFFYVNYTNTTDGIRRTRISRFGLTEDPNVADPDSENLLLAVTQPHWNHNAGDIHFGPHDGYLYIPLGDGGNSGDPTNNAQNPTNLLGAVSRIDVDMGPGIFPDCQGMGSGNYTIPYDNPFIDGNGGDCDEIWALGLRNPWRSSFDRQTGDYFIADVGQGNWEEVNFQMESSSGGENYGWRCYEGNELFNNNGCGPVSDYDFPVFVYASHYPANECAVVGGYVYRGNMYPAMSGRYFLTDYCTGKFWDLEQISPDNWSASAHTNLQQSGFTTFGEGADGELYVVHQEGAIYHLEEAQAVTPTPTAPPPTPAGTPSHLPIILNREEE